MYMCSAPLHATYWAWKWNLSHIYNKALLDQEDSSLDDFDHREDDDSLDMWFYEIG